VLYTSKKLALKIHGVERIGDLIIVGLDLTYRERLSVNVMTGFCCACSLRHHGSTLSLDLTERSEHTFWDLFEALVVGSHDCDGLLRDHKLCAVIWRI